jgi:hypothetical protein
MRDFNQYIEVYYKSINPKTANLFNIKEIHWPSSNEHLPWGKSPSLKNAELFKKKFDEFDRSAMEHNISNSDSTELKDYYKLMDDYQESVLNYIKSEGIITFDFDTMEYNSFYVYPLGEHPLNKMALQLFQEKKVLIKINASSEKKLRPYSSRFKTWTIPWYNIYNHEINPEQIPEELIFNELLLAQNSYDHEFWNGKTGKTLNITFQLAKDKKGKEIGGLAASMYKDANFIGSVEQKISSGTLSHYEDSFASNPIFKSNMNMIHKKTLRDKLSGMFLGLQIEDKWYFTEPYYAINPRGEIDRSKLAADCESIIKSHPKFYNNDEKQKVKISFFFTMTGTDKQIYPIFQNYVSLYHDIFNQINTFKSFQNFNLTPVLGVQAMVSVTNEDLNNEIGFVIE